MALVSIHAPTIGAVVVAVAAAWISVVSIHAPSRGAIGYLVSYSIYHAVSIHAPGRSDNRHLCAATTPLFVCLF